MVPVRRTEHFNKMNPAEAAAKKQQERETLRSVIQQWNANRLDLFELSEPNEDLEFHGVMRFYFQDSGQKVATKCIRVASDATSQAVIETLIEKFRPDMRMLSIPEYALYEIHENGEERRLGADENPLLVQLNWHMDDREGRFLLRRIDDKTNESFLCSQVPAVSFQEGGSSFRRKLSKREKKQLKKQEKMNKLKSNAANNENEGGVAEKLYTELPETSFTRSISNPEAVMRRRRQQKLERKLQQFRSKDGGPDTGGTLKIYGESLCRDVPYKTLLLSVRDTAAQVVREMLAKYGMEREADPHNYCLVQVNAAIPPDTGESKEYHGGTNNREYILDDDECPLAILMNHPSSRGSIMFHVRRRPADYHPRKRKKKPLQKWHRGIDLTEYRYEEGYDRLPFFLELNPDGSDIVSNTPKRHRLHPNVTEVGSERPLNASQHGHQTQSLQLFGPNVQPRHCVIAHTEGIVTVTPCSKDAETYVNGQRIYETTILQHGAIVKFGRIHNFRFLDPSADDRVRQRHDSARQVLDYSYDRQSSKEDTVSHGGMSTGPSGNNNGNNISNSNGPGSSSQNYETTFDVDGNVETVSTSSLGNKEETRSQRSVGSSRDGNRLSNYDRYPRGNDPILPAVLEFREETEEAFLHAVVTDLDPSSPHFKLAPTYTLYLVARYRASTHYRPELTPPERAHKLTVLLARVAAMIHNVIQERYADAKSLAFWMANSSELLHFLKSDRHICAFCLDAQDILADCVQLAFRNLVSCLQGDLAAVMPNFMSERDDPLPEDENNGTVLQVLSSAMDLLRRCRVNAALTIQLFSQLFHFVNMWSFNKVVTSTAGAHGTGIVYCTREWGLRLKAKLAQLEVWAERQGLELAADCHLARIIQAAHLLQAPKYNADDLATLSSTCFKLNSLQLRALLSKYQPAPDEPRLPHDLIDNVVMVAENVADELARSDGREVRLEEEAELQLPFLLPEDGYSCDVVRGVPQGLAEFLAPLQHAGLCRLTTQPTSSGLWTIYMSPPEQMLGARSPSAMSNRSGGYPLPQQEPEVQIIKLNKSNNGMGLSIVAAKGARQDKLGIYIKSVVKGGAADVDGQLQAGDQLLKVDGQSLVGITQEKAAEYLVRTGPTVTLEVAKQGAIYHGLATLLQQPSPVMGRGPRRMSERDLPSRIMNEQNHLGDSRRNLSNHAPIQSSKSVPSLNSGNNDLVHGPLSQGAPANAANKQHEVFNPGYSRTSSTNSIPQNIPPKPYDGQIQTGNVAGLRSKSSQNLNDPRSPSAALPPSGLGSRQSSNPSLHPQHPPAAMHTHHGGPPQSAMSNQQLASQHHHPHPGPNQQYPHPPHMSHAQQSPHMAQHPVHPGSHVPNQHAPHGMNHHPQQNQHLMNQHNQSSNQQDGERFYQNLSIYRNQEIHNGYPPPSPNRGKLPSPQAHDDKSPTHPQKNLRGSQSSLHRPPDGLQGSSRDRPASAYIPQKDAIGSPQHVPGMAPRSQSTRDIMRQEAKLQEMQEEVRRRELRGGAPVGSPQHYPVQPGSHPRPQIGHMQHRVPNTNYPYPSHDTNGPNVPHPQHASYLAPSGHNHPPSPGNHPISPSYNHPRPQQMYGPPPTAPKPGRHTSGDAQRPPFSGDPRLVGADIQAQNRLHPANDVHHGATRHGPSEEVGYRDSPPPPPPPTSTHPLYQTQQATKQMPPSGHQDNRYTASMGEPPRGGYYPSNASGSGNPNQPRQFAFNATNPWEREEREKEQQRRREAARAWRDQQITELSALPQRSAQQEEQLRALKLEREFQRRAEEAARQEEEEEGEDDHESVERVQGLLRMATLQDDAERARNINNRRGPGNEDSEINGPGGRSVMSPGSAIIRSPIVAAAAEDKRRQEEMKREQEERKRREEEARQKHHQQMLQQQQLQQQQLQQQQLQQQQLQQQQLQQQQLQQQQLQQQQLQQQQLQQQQLQQQQLQQQQLQQQQMQQHQLQQQHQQQHQQQQQQQQQQLQQQNQTNPQCSRPSGPAQSHGTPNNQYNTPPAKSMDPSNLRLDNLVVNGPASPTHSGYSSNNHHQYNGYISSQSTNSNSSPAYYQHDHSKTPTSVSQSTAANNYFSSQESSAKSPLSPTQQSGAQRLDSLLHMGSSPNSERPANSNQPPQPPERGSSFTVMSQTQGVLRNSASNVSSTGLDRGSALNSRPSENSHQSTSATIKRVSFHDPNANQPPPPPTSQPPMERIREDPNHFINEAETLLASPKSPDGPFPSNTPGVIGAQEVYKDPRARLLAQQQHQKLMSNRGGQLPEKLSFKEKMKMFAMETGEDGTPKDKVKISRAQRDIDNLSSPSGPGNNNNNNNNNDN